MDNIEVPLEEITVSNSDTKLNIEKIKMDLETKKEKNKFSRFLTGNALVFVCVAALVFIVYTNKTNENVQTLIEVLKTIIFSLLGYLFGRKSE